MKTILLSAGLLIGTMGYSATPNHGHQKPSVSAEEGLHHAMTAMCENMDTMKMTGDLDKDFILMMIPHHQSALDMSKAYLTEGTSPELVEMAKMIIEAQSKEIKELQGLLKDISTNKPVAN